MKKVGALPELPLGKFLWHRYLEHLLVCWNRKTAVAQGLWEFPTYSFSCYSGFNVTGYLAKMLYGFYIPTLQFQLDAVTSCAVSTQKLNKIVSLPVSLDPYRKLVKISILSLLDPTAADKGF